MARFYQQMQDIATPLIRQFSQGVITLTQSTEGPPPDSTKPWQPGTISKTILKLSGTVTGIKAYQITNTEIAASDLVLTCATVDNSGRPFEPKETDELQIDGINYSIKKIVARPSAGTPVVFALFIAR